MKTLMYTTAAVMALSGAAMADDQMRAAVEAELMENKFSVDVASLTDEQVTEIHALTVSDNENVRGDIAKVLMDDGYARMELGTDTFFIPANSLRDTVELKLGEWGYDIEADTLSDQQVAALFFVTSGDEANVRAKVDAILQ